MRSATFLIPCLLISLAIPTGQIFAQPSGYFMYKTASEKAVPGSPEHLDLLLKTIDVIFHYDLDMALEIAERTAKLARESENTDALAAALIDQAVWTGYKFGPAKGQSFLEEANEFFDANGDPRFVAHYYGSRFGFSIINEAEEYNPNEFLQGIRQAAEKLNDPHLLMSSLYVAATAKVFVGGVPPTDKAILKIREELTALTEENGFETGTINLLLLDAQEARLTGDYKKAIAAFSKLAEYSKAKQYRVFDVRAMLYLGAFEKQIGYNGYVEGKGPVEDFTARHSVNR